MCELTACVIGNVASQQQAILVVKSWGGIKSYVQTFY